MQRHVLVIAIHELGRHWIEIEQNLERLKTEKQISINMRVFFNEFVFENRRLALNLKHFGQ